MADINTTIADFLRDAQYRVSELATIIDKAKRSSSNGIHKVQKEEDWRAMLLLWMDILYEVNDQLVDDKYNYLWDWTDTEIKAECEYLRALTQMAEVPLLPFAGFSADVLNIITGKETGNIPVGNENDYLRYDANGDLVAEPFPSTGGHTNETITQFFS